MLSFSGLASSSEVLHTMQRQLRPLRVLFSFGPVCRFVFPSIHVYHVSDRRFISGEKLKSVFPTLVEHVNDRRNAGAGCLNSHPMNELSKIFDMDLGKRNDYIVFFMDLPGKAPFEPFSAEAVKHRNEEFHFFSRLDAKRKVWIHMPPFVPES